MSFASILRSWRSVVPLLALGFATLGAVSAGESDGEVRVGKLTYGRSQSAYCFSEGFLGDVARDSRVRVARKFAEVDLADSKALFRHPFVVFSGEGKFELSDPEVRNLREFLNRGGFVLASAGCSNPAFADSFRDAMKRVLEIKNDTPPTDESLGFKPIPTNHKLFKSLYTLGDLHSRKVSDEKVELMGLEVKGRLAMVFAPLGLNDTADAGGECCCCGGNEIREARQVNANLLVYVLTR